MRDTRKANGDENRERRGNQLEPRVWCLDGGASLPEDTRVAAYLLALARFVGCARGLEGIRSLEYPDIHRQPILLRTGGAFWLDRWQ